MKRKHKAILLFVGIVALYMVPLIIVEVYVYRVPVVVNLVLSTITGMIAYTSARQYAHREKMV